MKKRQGSTLIMVLMIFVVLSILATATLSFMVSENKQSIYQKNKIQAYYIARSGAEAAEAAIMEIYKEYDDKVDSIQKNEKFNEKEKEDQIEKISPKKNDIGTINKIVQPPEINFENKGKIVEITLKKEGESLTIKSIGRVGKSTETVEKKITENNNKKQEQTKNMKFDYGLYAGEKLIIQDAKKIDGSMATKKLEGNYKGEVTILKESEQKNYPLYKFPNTPIIPDNSEIKNIKDIKKIDNTSTMKNLGEVGRVMNYYYDGNLSMIDSLTFNDKGTVNLYILGNIEIANKNNFVIQGGKHANIYTTGSVKFENLKGLEINTDLNLYVADDLILDNIKKINIKKKVNAHVLDNIKIIGNHDTTDNHYNDLNIYNYGKETIIGNPGDNISLNANLYNLNSNIKIELDKFHYKGNIISNGNEIIINQEQNNFQHYEGSIYAPNSTIIIEQGSPYKIHNGGIIGKIIEIKPGVDLDIKKNGNISVPTDESNFNKLKNSYQSYYK